MSQTMILTLFVSVFLLACFTGCSTEITQPENPAAGLANPASVYCQGLGFKEEIRQNELGQFGVCVFPDGSECDSWDFLAGRCGQEHSYCVDQGYDIQAIKDGNIANCIFDDGSTCSEYLYFQGECKPGENHP